MRISINGFASFGRQNALINYFKTKRKKRSFKKEDIEILLRKFLIAKPVKRIVVIVKIIRYVSYRFFL